MELDAVLEGAQELVGSVQGVAVLPSDVPAGGEDVERLERAGVAEMLIGAPVHQLEQLDGELDIAKATGSQLELAVGLAGRNGVEHTPAHRLHVADEADTFRDLPHHRLDQRQELL